MVKSFQVAISRSKIINFGSMSKFTIAVHGGSGTILKSHMTDELEAAYKKGLADALEKR